MGSPERLKRHDFFRSKMEELGGSLGDPAIARVSKEYELQTSPLGEYSIEIKEPLHWILTSDPSVDSPIQIDIQFPENYPYKAPIVQIINPYYLYLDYSKMFGPAIQIAHILKNIRANIDSFISTTEASLDPNTRQSIKSAKESEDPLYLIMGSNPTEKRSGRTFYDDVQYYMLDYLDIPIEINRYFHINFNDVDKFMYLAMQLPNRFQTICFDWATMKFFTGNSKESLFSRIYCLKNLLKSDGRIYFERGLHGSSHIQMVPGNTPGSYKQVIIPPVIDIEVFTSICNTIGLHITETTMQFADDPVLHEVYGKRDDPPMGSQGTFLVASKQLFGGKRKSRRKSRRKTRKTRKGRSRRN